MDERAELSKFTSVAAVKYRSLLSQGYSESAGRFNNSNLQKRWLGWLDCARYREETKDDQA